MSRRSVISWETIMKIVAIDTYPWCCRSRSFTRGRRGPRNCRSLIVRVKTENGIKGWGEATQGRPGNTYETLERMEIMAQKHFAPALIEMDLEQTGAVLLKLHRARQGHPITKAAIEMALSVALAGPIVGR
jgi:L-alanine-DL-glutamate epimerase-like enolase superfamily enzyme